ncbi:bifunctional 2-polyprenyl-6-hydroxyphenol methylase/3-demethylubiquinol 3-O-methyltransferase UbiG [Candidatus Liberibacter americanus]|uniref:Ubiquinone biosynthesis O-methyltransferase n=1 Tax=Candidatus Liberibacter americanus str. Sao Paulo TaxID=1261131 RepID=U6B4D4_9HYPH|nr:bifunctional 2-polyprenyl-6-hydroxyphenol methylase/3-demethylubiquinol 3-O-methyltransferase UbiG [Candidatus Liberibacter americanus]AHA27929.1 2-polyprenyl-3-methyl-5-hydroxy-6-metoxy-1,4-benzoquinol methylase [Candidatus Liberibacter americanus str. Sao Paulo]EMS36072.1 3-demethylubiquinone-9 3-methyltransferase [Candidatus Liberibacter americanus PW_SP]
MKHRSQEYTTKNQEDINRFSNIASEWWNPNGKFRPLHKINPVRLSYIKSKIIQYFKRDSYEAYPLKGLRILDIGCGGGLLSEPIAKMGATVVGIDPSSKNIEIAKNHADSEKIKIDYRVTCPEELVETNEKFDVILNMEVIEHVENIDYFMKICCSLMISDGLMFISTINRNFKAMLLAIIGAEYILKWLPKGTHQYEKLVKPEEIYALLLANKAKIIDCVGINYNILFDKWSISKNNKDVNYIVLATMPKTS